jgi:hypothetical protein
LLPVTGASTNSPPVARTAALSSFTHATVSVLHSIITADRDAPASAPSGPSHIARDALSSATMLTMMSARVAASRGVCATNASLENDAVFARLRL